MSAVALAICGEFTIFTAREVHVRLLDALSGEGGEVEVEVDLAAVSDIDSAGLQLMLAARREAFARGRTLRFTGHSQAVLALLDFCELATHFGDSMTQPHDQGIPT